MMKETKMKLHPGINTTSIAGGGLEGLPGILITVAFVYFFVFMFAGGTDRESSKSNWILFWFLLSEGVACGAYFVGRWRERKAIFELEEMLRRLREDEKK